MILKGNNFRILTLVGSKYKCVGMASGCTVTLTSNTEESSTKDDVGLASKPTVVSKSWTVSVDSLDVTDAAAILTAIKSLTPFTLMWDETSTTDNQTGEQAAFARTGLAFLNDAVFNYNDRENSAKSLQFTGSGELSKITTTPTYEPVDASVYTKGQFVRLFLSSDNTTTPAAVIAAARQLSFHVSLTLENATTKDTPGDWQIQDPTGLSYDISSTALMRGNDTITSAVAGKSLADLEDIYEAGTPVSFQIANVSGDNQRTKGAVIVSGSVIIATLTMNGPNRQNADYTTALNGYGAYVVGA